MPVTACLSLLVVVAHKRDKGGIKSARGREERTRENEIISFLLILPANSCQGRDHDPCRGGSGPPAAEGDPEGVPATARPAGAMGVEEYGGLAGQAGWDWTESIILPWGAGPAEVGCVPEADRAASAPDQDVVVPGSDAGRRVGWAERGEEGLGGKALRDIVRPRWSR